MRLKVTALLVAALASPGWGSQQSQPPTDRPPVIRANVEVVNVLMTVRDRKGRYVTGLKAEDFEVYEDGQRQTIEFFNHETGEGAQPLTIVLLIDTSGSVKEKLGFEQKAASEFLQGTLRKNVDLAAVVQFDSEVNLLQDFTYDHSVLEEAILDADAGGATKLYDAIFLAVEDLLAHEAGRRVMVILSDGADTMSAYTDTQAIRTAQNRDVVIYGIGIRGSESDFGKLKDFATATGGLFFRARANLAKLREVFARINQEVKNQYSLAYVPTNPRRDGSFRRISVRVKGRGLKVTHRKGYYAGEPIP